MNRVKQLMGWIWHWKKQKHTIIIGAQSAITTPMFFLAANNN